MLLPFWIQTDFEFDADPILINSVKDAFYILADAFSITTDAFYILADAFYIIADAF